METKHYQIDEGLWIITVSRDAQGQIQTEQQQVTGTVLISTTPLEVDEELLSQCLLFTIE